VPTTDRGKPRFRPAEEHACGTFRPEEVEVALWEEAALLKGVG
jgi:hypothetical protein